MKYPYTIGQIAVMKGTFLDPASRNGLTLNNLELRIQPPAQASEIDIIGISKFENPSPGIYTFNQYLGIAGKWSYRFVSTGAYVAACEGQLIVYASTFMVPPGSMT